jgi:hypothetical protein
MSLLSSPSFINFPFKNSEESRAYQVQLNEIMNGLNIQYKNIMKTSLQSNIQQQANNNINANSGFSSLKCYNAWSLIEQAHYLIDYTLLYNSNLLTSATNLKQTQ